LKAALPIWLPWVRQRRPLTPTVAGHLLAISARQIDRRLQARGIQFTRSRPYKNDDNAHVEQTNWTPVRKLVGWDRYDTPAAQRALNALYAELRGSRLLRRDDQPQTPFERVRACAAADAAPVAALERLFRHTDPFVLAQRIATHLDRVASLHSRAPQAAPPRGVRWRGWTFSPRAPQSRITSATTSTHTMGSGLTMAASANAEDGRP
jgi:hypothetical protein